MNRNRRSGRLGLPTRYAAAAVAVLAALALAGGAHAAANPTKLSLACTPKVLTPGVAATCTATVTDSGPVADRTPPQGTVTFTVDGSGTLDPEDGCAPESSGAFSSKCTVAYTPTAIAGGSHTLLGTYNGEATHGRATAQFVLAVTPTNDELAAATPLPVPGRLTGTTEGATFNWDDDPELCSDAYAPVWYAVRPAQSGRIAVRLTVQGRVDAVVAVFRQDRSKLTDLGCELTGTSGVAGVPFDAERGAAYLVAVAAPWDAHSGGFTIDSAVVPPVRFPGARLARDAEVRLDPLLHPDAAYALQLHEAVTYRIAASAPGACVSVKVLPHGASAAAAPLAESDDCSGYLAFTPGPGAGGVLPLVVSMPEGRAAKVHVAVRRAEGDDLAPGLPLADGQTHRGSESAHEGDVVDVYRFAVDATRDADVRLTGAVRADLLLLDEHGKRLACACDGLKSAEVVKRLAPAQYFAVVRARPAESGRYALSLRLRTPTTIGVRLTRTGNGLAAVARVSPGAVAGHVVFELERFDPLTQWHFVRSAIRTVADGGAAAPIATAGGGWRVRARFGGTLRASASASGWITFQVDAGTHGKAGKAGGCGPGSTSAFAVGAATVTCGGGFAGGAPAPAEAPAKTPGRQIADLKAVVAALSTLKDPFKSDLLAALDDANTALGDKKNDDAITSLDQFVATLRSAPVQAQLPADRRNELIVAATKIKSAIG